MMEVFEHAFMLRAFGASICIGVLCALLGIFVVLRGMAFLTDALAHISLTGFALGLIFGINPQLSSILVCMVVALGIVAVRDRMQLNMDTSIGIFFSSGLAIGVLLIIHLQNLGYRVNLHELLFGQVLGIGKVELLLTVAISVVGLVFGLLLTRPVLQMSVNRDLAQVHGVNVKRTEQLFMLLLALVIALSIQIVGAVLVGAMMVIPAAAAKAYTRSFSAMVAVSMGIGLLSSVLGIYISYYLDWPPGPTLVLTGMAFLLPGYIRQAQR